MTLVSGRKDKQAVRVATRYMPRPSPRVGIISGTAERNDCVSFRILQEYDNLRNETAERTVIGRNETLTLTLCLTLILMLTLMILTLTLP